MLPSPSALTALVLLALLWPADAWANSFPPPAPMKPEQVATADRALNRAAGARDRAVFRELLSPEVVFMAGELHRGRLAVLAIWQHLFDGKYDFRYEAETLEAEIAQSGEFGWAIGSVRTSFLRPGKTEPEVIDGHYLNLWTPDADGAWKLAYSGSLVVHPTLGAARDPRSGLMTAWPELADQLDADISLRWTPESRVRAASGDLAYTFGEYEASFTTTAEPGNASAASEAKGEGEADVSIESRVAGKGHFLAVWRKDPKGHWQLAGEGFTPPGIYGEQKP